MPAPGHVIDLKTQARQKILVADDEQEIASLIEDWLSEQFEVTVALNGKTTVQKAIWHRPDVILLDVVMPDMGGYEVARMLQGAPQTQSIPLIVMTAKNFDDSTIQMIKAEPNVCGFINKPFKPSELIKLVQMVLAGGRTFSPPTSPTVVEKRETPVAQRAAPLPPPGVSEPLILRGASESLGPLSVQPGAASSDTVLAKRALDRSREGTVSPPGRTPRSRPAPIVSSDNGGSSGGRGWSLAVRFSLKGALVAGIFLLGMEAAVRLTEDSVGRRLFVPPVFAASSFNSFVPYQWYNPKITKPTFWYDGAIVYRFNQWGLRGPDFPLVARDGVTRVLLLGGGFVFGKGRTEGDTLAHRLETRLNRTKRGTFEVINAGWWALSPEEQWAYAEGQGFNFKPRVILWLAQARGPGEPSTEGLRWLTGHRWLVAGWLGQSRLIRLLVQKKIEGKGGGALRSDDPLFVKADALARERGVTLHRWMVPSWDGRAPPDDRGIRWIPLSDGPEATYLAGLADRLANVLRVDANNPLDKSLNVD